MSMMHSYMCGYRGALKEDTLTRSSIANSIIVNWGILSVPFGMLRFSVRSLVQIHFIMVSAHRGKGGGFIHEYSVS